MLCPSHLTTHPSQPPPHCLPHCPSPFVPHCRTSKLRPTVRGKRSSCSSEALRMLRLDACSSLCPGDRTSCCWVNRTCWCARARWATCTLSSAASARESSKAPQPSSSSSRSARRPSWRLCRGTGWVEQWRLRRRPRDASFFFVEEGCFRRRSHS